MNKYTDFFVKHAAMIRFICEIAQVIILNLHFHLDALSAIQAAAEMFILQLFQEENLPALHLKRLAVELHDMQLVFRLMELHNFLTMKL